MDKRRSLGGIIALAAFAGLSAAAVPGCTGGPRESTLPPAQGGMEEGEDQVAQGAELFAMHCAECHGAAGEGSDKAPAVVGPRALPVNPPEGAKLRKNPFYTAADLYQLIKVHMPNDAPGTLTDDEYAAIVAFVLKANGIDLMNRRVDPGNAASFMLHPVTAPGGAEQKSPGDQPKQQ
jgi:cytochrome c